MVDERIAARSGAASGFDTVIYEKRDGVAWVTLNRPDKFNAYNVAMRDDLFAVLAAVHEDSEVRAMVLTGAGRAFSTGGDVSEFGQAPSPAAARWIRFRRDVWGRLKSLTVPTVAAVHGFTVGGGLEMALLCDIAVASEDTRFCLPETGLGMIPGVAGTQTASRRLPLGWALDLCLTGRWIDARQGLFVGLVADVVPLRELDRTAHALALKLGALPRELVAAAKLAVWEGLDTSLVRGLEIEHRLGRRLTHISSVAEGVSAAARGFSRRR
ncbi:MAG: enoyl-CoA hydratase/isomerase family protein [Candidatus Binataceae bacterium]